MAKHAGKQYCSHARKRRYATEDSALMNAAHMAGRNTTYLRTYHCVSCNGYHLTKRRAFQL